MAPAAVYLGAQTGLLDLKNAIYGLCVVTLLYHAAAWEMTGLMAQRRKQLGGGRDVPAPFWSAAALRSAVLGFCIIFATIFGWIGLTMVGSLLTYGDSATLEGISYDSLSMGDTAFHSMQGPSLKRIYII